MRVLIKCTYLSEDSVLLFQEERMRKFTKLFIAVFALLICQIAIHAQTTGSINGTANDSNGAAVVGATVKLVNTANGATRTTVSGDKGEYAFSQLAPGTYTVTVDGIGFKKTVASDIQVEVAKIAEVTIVLQIGLASETVTVTGSQEVINTSSPSLTNVINTRQIRDLPLPSRNPMDLAALQAGIAVNGSDTRNAAVAGLRGSATNITIDGINAMDNFVKTGTFFALSSPSLNSIEEFSITTGTVGPDAGRGAAQVNMVTRSGNNNFHGSLFYLTNNSALQANAWFNNFNGPKADGTAKTLRPDIHQHFYGGTIGGPMYLPSFGEGGPRIYKGQDKSFFFFSYEGFREKLGAVRNRTVLSPEARRGLFRYVGSNGVQQTVDLLPLGNFHTLNPITQAQLNAMPLPDNALVGDGLNTLGWFYTVTGADPNDKYVTRIDQQIVKSNKWGNHKLEFVYNRAKFLLRPDTFNGLESPFPGGINAFQASVRSLYTFALHSEFGSSTNVLRYGRQWAPVQFKRDAPPTSAFIIYGSPTTNYDNNFMSQGRNTIVNQLSDNYVIPKGSHIFSLGFDFQNAWADAFNDGGINPTVFLGTNGSNPDGLLQTSFPFSSAADFARAQPIYRDLVGLLGSASATLNVKTPTSGFVPGFTNDRVFQQHDIAIFGQDQWRFKNNVTISLGLRWEYEGVPSVVNGLAIQPDQKDIFGISGYGNIFKPTAPAGPPPGVATLNLVSGKTGIPLYNKDWNNFAPFFGLAYSPNFDKGLGRLLFGAPSRSSIRLGYSISYLQDGFTVVSNAAANPGLTVSAANTTPTGVLTSAGVALPPQTFTIPLTDKQNFDLNPGNGLWTFDRNLRSPYVQQWNVGYEREIFKDAAIEIRYTGNHALKIFRGVDYNEVNIFENGFLNEFKNAQINLAARNGASFAPNSAASPCAACVALPILDKFFGLTTGGVALANGSAYGSSGFIGNLNANNVGTMANTLSFSNTYKTNRQSAAVGLPANFFVANPNAAFARILGNGSMSNYNSLQLEFRKRFSKGLQFQADYTFAKGFTDAPDNQTSQSTLANYRTLRNPRLDYRRTNTDQTHRFVANGIYELPFGKGRSFLNSSGVLNQIVGGWSIGTIVSWQSRIPFNITAGRTTFNSNAANTPAQLVGITADQFKSNLGIFKTPGGIFFVNPAILDITYDAAGKVITSKLKAGLMAAPAPGTFGNFPLNEFVGPHYFNVDLSAVKRFKVGEKVTLELKSSMINALNHPNFVFSSQNFDSTSFGRITTTSGGARVINFTGTMKF